MASSVSCTLFVFMLLLPGGNAAAEAEQARSERHDVQVSVERLDKFFQIDAAVMLPIRPCEAYALLTDYANLPNYIPGIVEIGIERLSDTAVKIRQVGKTNVLFFNIRVEMLLEMQEMPNRLITFKLIEGDLDSYSGEWRLQELPEGTEVIFSAELIFDRFMPTFLGQSILEDEVLQRIEAVVKEAEARKGRAYSNCDVQKTGKDSNQ